MGKIVSLQSYKEQPVPEEGKRYHIFDDGKISFARHYAAEVEEVIPFDKCNDEDLIAAWRNETIICHWLFAEHTDYFIKAKTNYDKNPLYFVRTVDGGWFSFDYPTAWMGARLDIDGSLYQQLIYNCFLRNAL